MTKIHIDICIPFYTYDCQQRYNLTTKIFNHYNNISKHFFSLANITFTLVGSEKILSETLVNKCFNSCNYTYEEYDQETFIDNKNQNVIYNMLTDKFKFSYKKSIEKKPNITLLAGSNDYICYDFFKQIIDFYNPNEKQLYGIDNYNNGNNCVLISKYDNANSKIKTDSDVWWNGVSNFNGRHIYNYCGGIIGFNDCLYSNHYNKLFNNIISCDEGNIEKQILELPNVVKFNSLKTFYFNLKTENNSDLNSYSSLINHFSSEIKLFTDFEVDLQKKIIKEHSNFAFL